MYAISFYYYYYFQNSGAPNDVFPLNAFKTLFKAVQSTLACEQQTHFRSSKRRPEIRLLFAG